MPRSKSIPSENHERVSLISREDHPSPQDERDEYDSELFDVLSPPNKGSRVSNRASIFKDTDPFFDSEPHHSIVREESNGKLESDNHPFFFGLGNSDFQSFVQRKLWRASIATVAIALLCTALYFWFRAETVTEERVLENLQFSDSKLLFEIDACDILFRDEGSSLHPDTITASVELEKSSQVTVDWISNPQARSFTIIVKNQKPFAYRYVDYFCDITVNVPKGMYLPYTHVEATGRIISSVRSYRGQWGNNSLSIYSRPIQFGSKPTFTPSLTSEVSNRPYVAINLYDVNVGRLDINISRGYVNVKRGIIQDGGNITTDTANVFLRLAQSFSLVNNRPDDFECLNAWQHNCTSWANDSDGKRYCDRNILLANSTTDPKTWPRKSISVNCTACLIHATALERYDERTPQTMKGSAFENIGFAKTDVARIKEAFNMVPPRDLVYFGVTGPGTATTKGRWVWSTRDIFVVFHPSYLDVFSIFLLSPRRVDLNVTLTPAFCPGLNDDSVESLVAIDALLKSTTQAIPRPDSLFLFENGFQNGWERVNERVQRDPESGEYFIVSPSFRESINLMVILILNILLLVFSAVYVTWLAAKKYWTFREELVDRWGSLWYEHWDLERERVMNHAGIFFLLEFIVGFPKQRRGFIKQGITVAIHLFFIFLVVSPLFVMTSLYKYSIRSYTGITPWATLFWGFGICTAYLLIAFACLFLYYLEIGIINRYLTWALGICTTIMMFIDLCFIINVLYWVLMGSLIKPARILPFASVAMVMCFHFIAFIARMRKLRNSLDDAAKPAVEGEEEHHETEKKLKGTLSVHEAVGILKDSELLSISDLTLREQIVQEILTFLLLVLFFTFLLVGFANLDVTAVGNGDTVGPAISTLIVFFIGSGVNIPLSQSSSNARKKEWEQKVVQEAQKTRARLSKQ
eukprot:TRINITY_DN2443_c0_g1_i5.p1 TRINITY_DN2443_c0_g1~~TRINITY_DN2443_c0_g1_i5.p1  ORF type:complete len:921 (-),score=276.62 TRINITY_DN2443_c0_g1_i5:97-2859(-)